MAEPISFKQAVLELDPEHKISEVQPDILSVVWLAIFLKYHLFRKWHEIWKALIRGKKIIYSHSKNEICILCFYV